VLFAIAAVVVIVSADRGTASEAYRAATITLVELLEAVQISKQSSGGKGTFAHLAKSVVAGDCPTVLDWLGWP
jgi:hypothetical protein